MFNTCVQSVSNGQQFVSDGQQFASDGQQCVSDGQQFVSDGQQFVSDGHQFVPDWQQFIPDGQQFVSDTNTHMHTYIHSRFTAFLLPVLSLAPAPTLSCCSVLDQGTHSNDTNSHHS